MFRSSYQCAATVLVFSGMAQAQASSEASASAGFSTSDGASTAMNAQAAGDGSGTGSNAPYSERYRPTDNLWEIGIFAGALFPSPKHKLYSVYNEYQAYELAAVEFGARIAYFPVSWFGMEGEFMMADGRIPDDLSSYRQDLDSNRANFFGYRGHLIAQLPLTSITPFILAGGSALGVNSQPMGRDTDSAGHAGVGLKIPVGEWFSLRAELRENIHSRANDRYQGLAFSEEALLGATFTLGRPQPTQEIPLPPPDGDKDTVPDTLDKCPSQPALTEDGCPLDSDGDGILDADDHCPQEAGIAPKGCPDPDTDGDGVMLPCDQCPEEKGIAPDGCPIRDSDGDGFLDDVDKCPKAPETKNGYQDSDGCPDEVPKEVRAFVGTIQGIQFARGKAAIRNTSRRTLKAAADVLQKFPSIRIEVSGHTSSEGNEDFNQTLSEDRAAAVRQWLLNEGIDSSRIESRGAGSNEPVAENDNEAGRRQNRRIEFKILTQ